MTIDIWKKFSETDARTLAIALSKKGSEEANALAGYFSAVVKNKRYASKYLAKAGSKAQEIKELFK